MIAFIGNNNSCIMYTYTKNRLHPISGRPSFTGCTRFSLTSNTRASFRVCVFILNHLFRVYKSFFSVGIIVIIKSNQLSVQSEQTDFYCVPAHIYYYYSRLFVSARTVFLRSDFVWHPRTMSMMMYTIYRYNKYGCLV